MEGAQVVERILNGVAAFDAEERGKFMLSVGGENVVWREAEAYAVRMAADLLVDGPQQSKGAAGVLAGLEPGFDPGSEELGVQATGGCGIQREHAIAERAVKLPAFVEKTLRCVSMGINYER